VDNKTNAKACHLSKPILYSDNLSIGYESKKRRTVLEKQLNAKIRNGEMVCLIGPNGCGKSTLMRTIAGLQKPLAGDVFISDVNLKKLSSHKYATLMSLVLTDKISADALTVYDIVSIGRYPYINHFAKLTKEDKKAINSSIEKVHLSQYTNRFFNELSDGEKQRVLIAKALAQDTPLIMLDEPTAHLDLPNRVDIMNILKQLAKETGKAILLSTHELDLALQSADTIWLMSRNTSMKRGAPEDLVLNGSFEKVFSGNAFDFDKNTGAFKVRYTSKGTVYIKGEGLQDIWTKRALEREGFTVTVNPEEAISIICKNGFWHTSVYGTKKKLASIAEVLTHLRHKEYYRIKQKKKVEEKVFVNMQ